jgi:enoyl-CoA hydratase/carnithine racemase
VSDAVRVETADGVAVVTVDNPPVNTLADAVLEQLGDVASELAGNAGVRSVVLAGAGDKAFMAGADLAEFQRLLDGEGSIEDHVDTSRRALGLLEAMPQPVVAAVQASAMGGGLEVALVCDLIVADPAARLGLPEVRLGLMPGAGGTARLPARIGVGPARELLLLGRAVTAEEGHRLGLVNLVSAPGAAVVEAVELATRLAALPARAVTSIKRVVAADQAQALERERAAFLELFRTDDVREGVAAFVEKRPPSFTHG